MLRRSKILLGAIAAICLAGSAAAQDCLTLSVSDLLVGEPATWEVSDGMPGSRTVIFWGTSLGDRTIEMDVLCATFGIVGGPPAPIVGVATFDADGVARVSRRVPVQALGRTLYFQAAGLMTCPDECVSNIVEGVAE